MVNVSTKAWRAEGSRMFIEPKKAVSVDELLHGMIVQSGNDASIALAETLAGSEEAFVERMNKEAARLGMKNTRFATATGLPAPQQVSTANDLALLARGDHPRLSRSTIRCTRSRSIATTTLRSRIAIACSGAIRTSTA